MEKRNDLIFLICLALCVAFIGFLGQQINKPYETILDISKIGGTQTSQNQRGNNDRILREDAKEKTKEAKQEKNLCELDAVVCDYEMKGIVREVSAYSEFDSCHTGKSCKMKSGKKAYIGAVACPRNIKLGTKVKIFGKIYICEDRTAEWVDGRYDIFMGYGQESYDKAIQWGVKKTEVELIS
jgi:3D (Asp-Asp-Asp) domain-containing protein